jgi:uncharacterized protein (TIGR03437 family)
MIQTIAGPASLYSGDGGPAVNADFYNIGGFRFDQSGNLFIVDTGNQRVREVTPGGIVTTIAGTGVAGYSGDGGPAISAQLYLPVAVSPDNLGNVYILDGDNRVRKINSEGIISTIAGNGTANFAGDGGPAGAAEIQGASDIAADNQGNLFIADTGNIRVRMVNPQGIISTIAGTGATGSLPAGRFGGPATAYPLRGPVSLALDSSGNLYIGDTGYNMVLQVNGSGLITDYAGGADSSSTSPVGQPPTAAYFFPESISIDAKGNLAIAGRNDGIYNVSPTGVVSQLQAGYSYRIAFNQTTLYDLFNNTIFQAGTTQMYAGAYEDGNSGDGGPATQALFLDPSAIAIDSQGNIYVLDSYASVVRKIAPDGIITHFAGNSDSSSPPGDGGPAAQANIGYSLGIAVDGAGNVYIAEETTGSVREVNGQGIISTVVSNQFIIDTPTRLAVDPKGNIYLEAYGGVTSFSPDGQQISYVSYLSGSYAWTIDSAGDIYWLTPGTLNKRTAGGTTTTVAVAEVAQSGEPNQYGLAVDGSGNVYISNAAYQGLVWEVTPAGGFYTIARENPALPYSNGKPGQVDLGSVGSLISDGDGNLYFATGYTWGVRELTAGCPALTQPIVPPNAVTSAASFLVTGMAPGELSAVFGENLGPAEGQVVPVSDGHFPTQYAGVSLSVNGYPAPLLYVSQSQVNFVTPFEVAGQNKRVLQMSYNGIASDAYYDGYGPSEIDLGIFAAANSDGSVNSVINPATAGSYVVVYGTGAGVFGPPETDGEIMGSALATPVLPVVALIDGQPATVLYAGSAPGLVAGVLQVNLGLSSTMAPGKHTLVLGDSLQTFSFYTK